MAGTSVTDQINDFIRGIELRDADLVEKTLKAKTAPDTPVSGFHPLFYLLATSYAGSTRDIQDAVTEDQYAKNTSRIIDLLFEYGAKVAEPEKYKTRGYKTLMDSLLLTEHVVDASTVLLHAIRETAAEKQPVYKPDINAIVNRLVTAIARNGEEIDVQSNVSEVLTALERVHNIVRQRLENPQTDVEKEIAQKYLSAAQEYTQPFKRPPVKDVVAEAFPEGVPAPRKRSRSEDAEDGLSESFENGAANAPSGAAYLKTLPKKDPAEVLKSLNEDLVGFETQKREAQSLVFSQQFAAALAESGAGSPAEKKFGEALIGPEGIGKSDLARKKAELLVALGLAGPAYVEFTRENIAAPSENLPVQSLAKLFSKADIINIEVPDPNYNLRNPMSDFTLRMVSALKASLQARPDKPVVFMSGSAETIKSLLDDNPGLEALLPKFTRFGEMNTDTLGKVFDNKLGKRGFKIDGDARELVISALQDIRKELGKEFQNGRGINRVIDALQGPMGNRLFGPDAKKSPTPEELRTVVAADIKSLDLYALLAGPSIAKRQAAGFNAKQRYTAS